MITEDVITREAPKIVLAFRCFALDSTRCWWDTSPASRLPSVSSLCSVNGDGGFGERRMLLAFGLHQRMGKSVPPELW